jgi:hypothetical protein
MQTLLDETSVPPSKSKMMRATSHHYAITVDSKGVINYVAEEFAAVVFTMPL